MVLDGEHIMALRDLTADQEAASWTRRKKSLGFSSVWLVLGRGTTVMVSTMRLEGWWAGGGGGAEVHGVHGAKSGDENTL